MAEGKGGITNHQSSNHQSKCFEGKIGKPLWSRASQRAGVRLCPCHDAGVKKDGSPGSPPLQLQRSITFWSGLLVMVFIGWAWRDAQEHYWRWEQGDWVGSSIFGGVVVERDTSTWRCFAWSGRGENPPDSEVQAFPRPSLEFGGARDPLTDILELMNKQRDEGDEDRISFSTGMPTGGLEEVLGVIKGALDRMYGAMDYRARGDWRLFLPHWLVLLGFAGMWAALLAWRARRRRRGFPQI